MIDTYLPAHPFLSNKSVGMFYFDDFQPNNADKYQEYKNILANEEKVIDEAVVKTQEFDEDSETFRDLNLGIEDDILRKVNQYSSVIPDLLTAYGEGGLSFRLPNITVDYYFDSATSGYRGRDNGYEWTCIVLKNDGNYYGSVWYFTYPDFPDLCGIFGMKSSLTNLLSKQKHRRGVAFKILEHAKELGQKSGKKKLIIAWPLPPMIHILQKLGWEEHVTNEVTYERKFTIPVGASGSHYFVFSIFQ